MKSWNNHFLFLKIPFSKSNSYLNKIGTNEKLRFWTFQIYVQNQFWKDFVPVNLQNMTPD